MSIARNYLLALAALSVVGVTAAAQAATMTWTNGTFSNTSILPTSNVVYAVDTGGGGGVTVTAAGIDWYSHQKYDTYNDGAVAGYDDWDRRGGYLIGSGRSTGDAGFDAVLDNYLFAPGGGPAQAIELKSLTAGHTYQVLLLDIWTGGLPFGGPLSMQAADGYDGTTLTGSASAVQQFSYQYADDVDPITHIPNPLGGYLIGTFTADATSQTLYLRTTGFDSGMISAFVVSEVVAPPPPYVPEPASLGVLGLGAVALLARRRRA